MINRKTKDEITDGRISMMWLSFLGFDNPWKVLF